MDILKHAQNVFDTEILALEKTKSSLDENFIKIVKLITSCEGKVIVTGMGKSGHIARKMAATFSSLGTSSFFLHPAEALHGDLGMVTHKDIVIAISYSGESSEVTQLLPSIKYIGATVIALSGNANSTLVKHSDLAQIFPEFDEACYLGLAPTSSTTTALVYGDSLAVIASELYGFSKNDFGIYHPSGALGKKLRIKVRDIMKTGEGCPIISVHSTLRETVIELSKKGLGIVVITDHNQDICGVITDGDLRRFLEKGMDIYQSNVKDVMSLHPICITEDIMAIEALSVLRKKNVSSALVCNTENKLIGIIRLQDIIDAGII